MISNKCARQKLSA